MEVERKTKSFRIVRKIARTYQCLPECLYTLNIKRDGETSVACGGFADIFRGVTIEEDGTRNPIALKVFRFFDKTLHERNLFTVGASFGLSYL